jgi:tetratricopeptide (TPR) repeat protein
MLVLASKLRRWTMPGLLLAFVLLLGGCATQTQELMRQGAASGLPRRVELAGTPFFAQERYQCGPASLAMALRAAGIAAAPDALVPQVYVPQREGSLQPEMLAAARRNGALAIAIPRKLDALLAEVAAGHPVIVLQNLSLPVAPLWHYAVAIGYDLDSGDIILRSGTTERQTMPLSTFEHTWARSDYWGMLALAPGALPETASEESVVDALVAFEKAGNPKQARTAYEAALRRWPRNLTLLLGTGNASYAAGDRETAAAAFKRAAEIHPDSVPALNNLASVLAELGRTAEARQAAQKAVAIGGPWHDTALATLRSIEKK